MTSNSDAAAISLCRENHVPIVVFELMVPGNIRRVVCGAEIGSMVGDTAMVGFAE